MAAQFTIEEIRSITYKSRDAWWTVLLVDPVAARLVRVAARHSSITPNRLTVGAFLLGVAAAACFGGQSYPWLAAGAVLFHLSFVLDCMDGKIARLTGTGSIFGAWLDYVFDRLRVLVCTVALMGGQFDRTGDLTYLFAGGAVIFLDMFRYLNALQIGKVKAKMRAKLAEENGAGSLRPKFVEELVQQHPVGAVAVEGLTVDGRPVVDLNRDFRTRFGAFVRFRNFLVRHRIRAHLVSGIEFQMAVFIIGPLTGLIVQSTVVAGALMVFFELLLIYKMWLATKGVAERLGPGAEIPEPRTPATAEAGSAGAAAPTTA